MHARNTQDVAPDGTAASGAVKSSLPARVATKLGFREVMKRKRGWCELNIEWEYKEIFERRIKTMLSVYIEYKVVCTAHVSLILHVLDLLIHTVFTGKHRGRSLKWCCLLVGEPSKISTFISPYYSHCSIRSTSRLYRWLSIRRRVYIHDGMAPCIHALARTLSKCSTPFFSFPYLFFLPRRIGMKIEFICLWQKYTDNYYDVAGVVACAVYPQAEIDFTNANNKTGCNAQEWWSCLPWFIIFF